MPLKLLKIANVSGVRWVCRSPSMFRLARAYMRIGPWFLTWIRRRGGDTPKDLNQLASSWAYTPTPRELPTLPPYFVPPAPTTGSLRQRLSRLDRLLAPMNSNSLKLY